MVRAYPPQAFHGDVQFNTNYPPQSDNEGGSIPPAAFFYILEDSSGFYEIEDDSGFYELEDAP